MNNLIKIGVLTCALAFTSIQAQVQELWTKELKTTLKWHKVYASGDYLVCSYDGLKKVDVSTGNELWNLTEFIGIEENAIEELEGSSLLKITKNENIFILDPFSGKVKFDALKSGITEILRTKMLYQSNRLFIAGKNKNNEQVILMVDNEKGEVTWRMQEEFKGIISVVELSATEMLLVTVMHNFKINLVDGSVIWKNALSEDSKKLNKMSGAFGALVKDIAVAAAEQSDVKIQYYEHPTKDIFVIAAENAEQKTNPDGTPVTSYTNSYVAFKKSDGARIWNDRIEMRGKLGECTFFKNNFIVLPNDELKSKLNMFDLSTGEKKWGKKGRGTRVAGGVVNHFITGDNIMVVFQKNGKNRMVVLDIYNGKPKFKKPVKISGNIVFTRETSAGILYMTTNELNTLNINTGKLLHKNSFHTQPALTAVEGDEMFFLDINFSLVKKVNFKSSAVSQVSTEQLIIQGKENYNNLELRENGILLTSDQNITLLNKNGKVLFNNYFPAPKQSGLRKALLYAQAARAAYIGAQAHYVAGALNTAASETKNETGAAMLNEIGDAYSDLGSQASEFTKQSMATARERFKASAQGRDFMIVLAAEKKLGNFLYKVSKNSGEVLAKIALGKEKAPNYTVDDVTGQVFKETLKNGNIVSYKF